MLSISLSFPLPNRTADTVTINSVFDHSVPGDQYTPDGVVVDYTGERGESQFGQDPVGGTSLYGFKNATGSLFVVNGHYSGGSYLYYDGHPGYDFRTSDQGTGDGKINVLAAASGTVQLLTATNGVTWGIRIDHGNGYETNYYHVSRVNVSGGASVTQGQVIGVSGGVDANGNATFAPHLHFSVTLNGTAVDPYGWQGTGADPYTAATNVSLWTTVDTPTNYLPSGGASNRSLTPMLAASAFSDPDSGDTQAGSQWQVMLASSGSVVYDSGQVGARSYWNVPYGYLANDTSYTWHVRYQDNHGAWSDYSTATTFTTMAATTWYVSQNAHGAQTGHSWADTFISPVQALAAANAGDEIWVADGTYYPTSGTDRSVSFQLKDGVAIYGGFSGTETSRNQRNWGANPTILSGDIGIRGDASDNSRHVLYGGGNSIVIDGFTVTGGNSNVGDSYFDKVGGGMEVWGTNLTVQNVVFQSNSADSAGGAAFLLCSATVANCLFLNNKSAGIGAGIDSQNALNLVNCTFVGNEGNGYVIHSRTGGAINVANCVFWGNTALLGWAIDFGCCFGATLNVQYTDAEQRTNVNAGPVNLSLPGNRSVAPMFVDITDPDGPDNRFGTPDDGLRLQDGSPAANVGSNHAVPIGVVTDHVGDIRIRNGIVDMGAYESTWHAQVVTMTQAPLAYPKDGGVVVVDPEITIHDEGVANLVGATVTISGNYAADQDILGFTAPNGITGSWNAAAGRLTLSGTSNVDNYQAALRSVTYANTSTNPNTLTRTIAFQTNDGVSQSPTATRTVMVLSESNMWGPLFTFPTWNQSGTIDGLIDWNSYCPIDPATSTRSVTGCVATAVAQLLYYWQYPTLISFSTASDGYTPANGIRFDADYATYDFPSFSELTAVLSSIEYDGSANEEALLSFAVGVKAQTNYRSSGSSAVLTSEVLTTLGFASADVSYDWNAIEPTVIANIKSNKPVLVSVFTSDSFTGHAVVLDGYNSSDNTFHVNLGWGPGGDNENGNDNWYSLPVIDAGGYTYTSIGAIIYNIRPEANHAPLTVNDAYIVNEGAVLRVSAKGVLTNDTDADGDFLTAVRVSGPSHGTVTLGSNGSFTYTPTDGYHGSDSFTYKANDGSLNSNVATVNLTVNEQPSVGSVSVDPNPVTQGNNLILTANNVSDSDGTVAKVEFYRDTNSNGVIDVGTDTLLGTDTSVSGGWNCTVSTSGFEVGANTCMAQAVDNDGAVGSPKTTTVTVQAAAPVAPSSLSATAASASQINLSWLDNSGNETAFKIERKMGSGGSWSQTATVGANVTSYQNTGLSASTTYYYRVQAYSGAGDSGYSNEANATTYATIVTRTWDGGGADNKWSTPANWADNVAPQPGDNLVFPNAVLETLNDYPADTRFGTITYAGGSATVTTGINATTVDVQAGQLMATSIVANTLTIGAGGSVVIAETVSTPATRTWDGGGADNKWSTPANWVGNVAPSPGDNLIFPSAASETLNDYPAGTKFGTITCAGGNATVTTPINATTVNVQAGQLTVASIVADTLTIGAGCSVVIAESVPTGDAAVLATTTTTSSTTSLDQPNGGILLAESTPTKTGQVFVVDDWDNKVTENDLGFNYFSGNTGAVESVPGTTALTVSAESRGSTGGSLHIGFDFSGQGSEVFAGYFASLFGLTDTFVSLDGTGQKPPSTTSFPGYFLDTTNIFRDLQALDVRSVERLAFDIRVVQTAGDQPMWLRIELKDEADHTVFTRIQLTSSAWQAISLRLGPGGDFNGGTPATFDWAQVSLFSAVIERNNVGDQIHNPDSGELLLDNLRLIDLDGQYIDLAAMRDPQTGELNPQYETDFLEYVRETSSAYFLDFASTDSRTGGIVQDRGTFADLMTIGGVGFQLSSYVVDAERGYLDRADVAQRVLNILNVLWSNPQGFDRVGTIGYKGFFYHFVGIDGLRKQNFDFPETSDNEALNTVELSTIDTALAIAGVVTAGQYFQGSDAVETAIRLLADQIYSRVDWHFMLNSGQGPQQNQFYLGWKPNEQYEGAPFEVPDGDAKGHYSGTTANPSTLDYYTDEGLLVALLAMGSPNPAHRLDREVWDAIWRDTRGGSFAKTYPGALFTYQFLSAWVDTEALGLDNHPASPVNFFNNTQDAIQATRDYVSQNALGRATYANPLHWGLSACEGPFDEYSANAAPPAALATDAGLIEVLRVEAENGSGQTMNQPRGNASGQQTAWFTPPDHQVGLIGCDVSAAAQFQFVVRYSNDGPSDQVQILLDGVPVGDSFWTENTRPSGGVSGSGWDTFKEVTASGLVPIAAGHHELTVNVLQGDTYGVEIDYIGLDKPQPLEVGTVTNYAVASSILHVPAQAIAALWNNAWDDLNQDAIPELLHPRFGFADAFNLDITQAAAETGVDPSDPNVIRRSGAWVQYTGFAIDHGPTLIMIDNYLGNKLIPSLFMSDANINAALRELFRTHTWDGGGGDNKWSTAGNWADNVAPQPGDDLVFPSGASQMESVNDYPAGTKFGTITYTGGSAMVTSPINATTVDVQAGQLTATSIVANTLTIGAGCSVVIAESVPTGDAAVLATTATPEQAPVDSAPIVESVTPVAAVTVPLPEPSVLPPESPVSLLTTSITTFVEPLLAITPTPAALDAALALVSPTLPATTPAPSPIVPMARKALLRAAITTPAAVTAAERLTLDSLAWMLAMEQSVTSFAAQRHLRALDAVLAEGTSLFADSADLFAPTRPMRRRMTDRAAAQV